MGKRGVKKKDPRDAVVRAAVKIARWADAGNGYLLHVRNDDLLHMLGRLHGAVRDLKSQEAPHEG